MANRKSTGKRLRFEIFKRDKFMCQYCGAQPPDVTLVIDHIAPVSSGGDNDPMNLITACETCNQGKADKALGNVSPKPDADLEWLAMQQEIAELRRYQIAKIERDRLLQDAVEMLQDTWVTYWNDGYPIDEAQVLSFLAHAEPALVERAIRISASHSFHIRYRNDRIKYTWGVLKRLNDEQHNGDPDDELKDYIQEYKK